MKQETIQNFILTNYETLTTYEMADKLKVKPIQIAGNISALQRKGLLNERVKKAVSVYDNVLTDYQIKQSNKLNTYSNHDGINKNIARNKMANIIIDSGIGGLIPTLPHTDWKIEQMILNGLKDIKFLGIENDTSTFVLMCENLKKLKLKMKIKAETYFGQFSDKIFGKFENSYAHLIMDYCGELHTKTKEIEYVINNDLVVVGGCICITFAKPMRGVTEHAHKLKGLAAINNIDNRCMSDRAIEAYFNKITGWNYHIQEFYYYQDTYPMTLVIIKRLK